MMEESDDDRGRNPPQLPSTYVTLVQLEQRWLQEKERKQREKEERDAEQERKAQKIHKEEAAEGLRNQQQQQQMIESVPSLPRRNHRPVHQCYRWVPCEKSCSTTIGRKPPVESSRFGAIVVKEDGISREADDCSKKKLNKNKNNKKKKNGGRPRDVEEVEEELIGRTEQVEKEKILVVGSRGSKCEKEENGDKFEGNPTLFRRDMKKKRGNNKNRRVEEKDMANGREQEVLPERGNVESENVAVVVSTERECEKKENERKCEGSGGRRWNARLRPRGTKNDWGNNKNKMAEEEEKSNGREQEMLPKKENVKAVNVAVAVLDERESVKKAGRKCEGSEEGNGRLFQRAIKNSWGSNNDKMVEEEELTNGREQQLLPKEENVEAENVLAVGSSGREGGGLEEGNGKNLVVSGGRDREKRVVGPVNGGRVWENYNKKRVEEEDLINCTDQQVLPKEENVEAENVVVVGSSGREGCGLEEGNGKNLVVSGGRVWENKNTRKVEEEQARNGADQQVLPKEENVAVMVSTEGQGGGLEGNGKNLVVNGGRVWGKRVVGTVRGGYERNARNVNGSPRMMYGGVNSRRLMRRPRDLNLVWVRKEEGGTSDAGV